MTPHSTNPPFPKNLKWVLAFSFACFLATYFILQLKYRIAELDDTWWLTYAYNFVNRHITYDLFAGTDLFGAGVQSFGKTYAFLMGTILNFWGWTKPHAFDLSLFFLLGGTLAWYFVLRRFQYSRELSATFCVTSLLLDPFFSAAVSARAEAFIFFVSSLSLLLFVWNRYFWAALAAWICLETHPVGSVAFFLMAAAFWGMNRPGFPARPQLRRLLFFGLTGFSLGALYYCLLHSGHLAALPQGLLSNNQISRSPVQNFIFEYYFLSKYNRHLAELALLAICSFEFFRKKAYRTDPLVLPLILFLLLFSLVIRRPNFHYPLFFYPAFLLMVVKVFEIRRNLPLLTLGFLGLLLPQYAFVYHLNHSYDYNLEIQSYQKLVPDDSLPILGSPDAWFAFPRRDFYSNRYRGDLQKLGLRRFYLIKEKGEDLFEIKPYVQPRFDAKLLGEFSMDRWKFVVALEEPLKERHPGYFP